jgi:hypothetical protein
VLRVILVIGAVIIRAEEEVHQGGDPADGYDSSSGACPLFSPLRGKRCGVIIIIIIIIILIIIIIIIPTRGSCRILWWETPRLIWAWSEGSAGGCGSAGGGSGLKGQTRLGEE